MTGNVRGDMAINFSCAPENAGRLVDLALDEVEALQAAGPSAKEVMTCQWALLDLEFIRFMVEPDAACQEIERRCCRSCALTASRCCPEVSACPARQP